MSLFLRQKSLKNKIRSRDQLLNDNSEKYREKKKSHRTPGMQLKK